MFYHLAFGCAIRNGVFGVTVGSLGSLVLCREPQAEDTHPVSRPEGGCDALEHPLQEPFWLPWEGTKQLWQWGESQQRPMAVPYGAPGSGLPPLCKPRAAHSSLLRRALLNLRPLATALVLMDYVHLKLKPWQGEAGSQRHAPPLRKRSCVHHEWWTTESPRSRHGSAPVGPPRLSTAAAKAVFKLLVSKKKV